MLHAGRQSHGIAARVALHALGLARGARGVERVADVLAVHPFAGHLGVEVLLTQSRVIMVAPRHSLERCQTTVDHEHGRRLVLAEGNGFVQQRFVRHHLAATRTRVRADDQLGCGVLDARGQGVRRKTAKHHRMDGTDAHTGQHGKRRLGDHGHVNQHPVALAHAQALQDGGHALYFLAQLGKAVGDFGVGFGRDIDERGLIGLADQVTVHRVVAQIGLAAHVPVGKRGI